LLLLLFGCTGTWVIEPYRVPCQEGYLTTCLLTASGDQPAETQNGAIEGFTFALGERVTATVRTTSVVRPPRDGSTIHHKLVSERSRESAVVESFDVVVDSTRIMVDVARSTGLMVDQPWTCEASVCAEIAGAIEGAGPFEVTFMLVEGAVGVELEAVAVGPA
jgi:hypothetical protein